MKKLSLLLVVIMVAFASCKKDKNAQDAIDNAKILTYIKANNLTAMPTGSGLYYVVTTPGDATQKPIATSTVEVRYRGFLLDSTNTKKGIQFDASYELGNQPAKMQLLGTIKGFSEGFKYFGKGATGQLIIPSSLGYGVNASGPIPANSVLIFDVELVNFQ